MQSMSEMSVLERLRFLTMKAEQALERTANIMDYRQFMITPEGMDLFDATTLRLQVVGEMLKQVDDLTDKKILIPNYPEIPWRSIFGLRNLISQEYCKVDPEEIYSVVKDDLPTLINVLHRVIADYETGVYD